MWHKIMHSLRQSYWENTDHLPVPGYSWLYRQRCTRCGATRVRDLVTGREY